MSELKKGKDSKAYERAQRTRGYNDGLAGRERRSPDPAYWQAWKRGLEKRKDLGLDT